MKQNSSYGWGSFWSFIFWCFIIFIVLWWIWAIPTGSSAGSEVSNGSYYSWWWWLLLFIGAWWLIDIIFYIPVGVQADDESVRVKRVLNSRNIPLRDIASARPYEVTTSKQKGVRISPAAFSAKWGTFFDPEIGDYAAYYSNPKKTVLITLNNGEKLVVGSSNPQALADYINSKLKK